MLVLTRKIGEEIIIDGNIRVTVTAINGDKVRLGFTAPADVSVHRSEVAERLRAQHTFEMEVSASDFAVVN